MMKMQSCGLTNGQHQQIRPASQPSQAGPPRLHEPMTNCQSWTGNNTFHYAARNVGVQNAHGGHFPLHNGAYSNRQVSNLQTSAGTYQGASSQTGGGDSNDYYFRLLLNSLQNSSANSQSGNPCLPASGFQVPALQDFHQNSSTQSLPNQINSNATYLQKDMSANWKWPVAVNEKQTMGTQDGRTVTDFQNVRVQTGMQQNVIGALTKPISAYSTTATSLAPEQALCTSTVSASEHSVYSVQVVSSQVHGQKDTQHGFSVNLPSYYTVTSQPLGNKNVATHTPSNAQNSYLSSTSQKTQQYPVQQSLTHNSGIKVVNSSHSNSHKEHETVLLLAKKRELPRSPFTQQHVPRHMLSASSLCNSNTPGSDGCPPPPPYSSSNYRKQQSVRTTTKTLPYQCNMQPGTSVVSKNCNNLNAIQFLQCQSGQSLPKTTQSVRSVTQHSVRPPLQQNSVPNIIHASTAGNGSGINKSNDAFLPNKKYSRIGLLSDSSLPMPLTENISPQGNETQSSVAGGFEMPSIQQNNSSVLSSPGHTGTKAVAVVQPLPSLESHIPNSHASCDSISGDSLNNPEKIFISQATAINREATYLKDCEASSQTLDSGTQNTRKQPECDVNVVQVQNSVPSAVPVSQNCPKDQSRMETLSTSQGSDLSSLPTTPWTAEALINLIRYTEKAQKEPDDLKECNPTKNILDLFWDGKLKTLHTSRTSGLLKDLFADVKNFCQSYFKKGSVVLWQVNGNFEEQMKNYHVLKDDEVFSELPYKSSWLNVSKQLDEIDKEFGFPWTLNYHIPMLESSQKEIQTESQKDQVNTNNSIPAFVSKVPTKVLPPIHFEPVNSGEEKEATTLEAPSSQNASPNKTDDASDPCLLLKIQVLPPEEAKHFYEQQPDEMPQSMDTDSQAEMIRSSSMESETPDDTETTSSESKEETGEIGLTKEICCLAKLVEMVSGSSTHSLCKCQDQEEQNYEDSTSKILDNGETVELKHNNQFEIIPGSKFYPAMEGEDLVQGKEDIGNQILVFSGSELCSTPSQMIDLTKDDQPESSKQNPQNTSQKADSSHSDIIFISDDEALSNSKNEILSQATYLAIKTSECEDECGQEQLKSTETKQSGASVSDKAETEKFSSAESEIVIQVLDPFRSCEEAPDVAASSLETKGQTAKSDFKASFSQCVEHKKTKRKHEPLECHDELGPPQKESKKYNSSVDLNLQHALDGVSKCDKELVGDRSKRTVELVLFGSAQQDRHALSDSKQTHSPSLKEVSNAARRPPEVLTVNLNTSSSKSCEAVYTGSYSVKQQIHEKWWRSFQPTKAMYRNKLKRLKCRSDSIPGPRLKNDKLSVSSKMKVFDGKSKRSQSLKMERSHIKRLGQENGVLKFSVLPSNFNFKDGASGRKEFTDPVSDPDFKEKDQNLKTDVTMPKGIWCPSPKKNYSPLRIPKTFGLFHEYQKKYKERSSKDK
ncbi:protein AMN1 homolog [Archocentrus centrarchus]|uniref:protein AMN1 homolog n=1 Tax=Archocentrus centrarchus TaxID=63155 RepID=UPI0011EA17FA|nr:uncharacterized protein LOC115781108 [Archocentrus centrarchus]